MSTAPMTTAATFLRHPLEGVSRIYSCTRQIQGIPGACDYRSGPSYLREYAPNLAAGAIEDGVCQMVGFGREAFAYPFPQGLAEYGKDGSQKGVYHLRQVHRADAGRFHCRLCHPRMDGTYLPFISVMS